ncbi:uncharacterized protein A4U43_C07F21520 [Asparagus officinalis]|uniref:Uncharacterized protein n=1 Tax=Asparagus officinalis TaxID=4686 RepID=A0A5P1EDY8_ASPOF|nr:uncharacterized protein A4U43_C07F21520 [Asparagus officinalis]
MAGREVREYTNLSDPKDKKWGKGKDKIDDEDITFQRMVAKMQEVAGERGGYLHGRGALDSDDLLYLKEQMEAEEDAERLLPNLADSSPASVPLSLRVEPKPKSGIRQQDLLKHIVEIKPKKQRVNSPSDCQLSSSMPSQVSSKRTQERSGVDVASPEQIREQLNPSPPLHSEQKLPRDTSNKSAGAETESKPEDAVKTLLGLAYESSDED